VQLADFERFVGKEARVELSRPIDGRRRFQGRLMGTRGEMVRLAVPGSDIEVEVPHADIQRAKLVLNDEMLSACGRSQADL
jgi:ribosome maturation factor RimP